jgi:hypothetical protein
VARVLVRRILEPLALWVGQDPREQVPEWMVPFETAAKPEGLLVGLEGPTLLGGVPDRGCA